MMNPKEIFKNHTATFLDLGMIKILDFKKPGCEKEHRIKFLFEEDTYTLHITGDFGNLTAVNESNMCYEKFGQFNDPSYFEEKVKCHDRPFYEFDEASAREELAALIEKLEIEEEIEEKIEEGFDFYNIDDFFDGVFEDFAWHEGEGIGPAGLTVLNEYVEGIESEDIYRIGMKSSGILEFYLSAFNLAKKRLEQSEESFTNLYVRYCYVQ